MTLLCTAVCFLLTLCIPVFAGYNPNDAYDCFTATMISSNPIDAVLKWDCKRCPELPGYRPFSSQLITASKGDGFTITMLYNPDSKKFIIAFPGTATLKQLLLEKTNLAPVAFELHNVLGAKSVRYFYNRYSQFLQKVLFDKIQQAYKSFPDYTFIFTGHSLGAALTTLAAFDVVSSGSLPSSQVQVYNFGSPRVGNQALAQAIEKAIPEFYRIVHWRDPVPHIPLCMKNLAGTCVPTGNFLQSMLGVWPTWHIGQQVFYNANNTDYVLCDAGEDQKCANQFRMKDTTWADHFSYMGRDLPLNEMLLQALDTLTKLLYPSL